MQPIPQPLEVSVTGDMNWESKIDHVLKVVDLRRSFEERACHYGGSLRAIGIVLMCRDPAFEFTQRIRFQKSTRTFSMDVMLSLPQVIPMTHPQRRQLVAHVLLRQVPERLRRYKFDDFDYPLFEEHWANDIHNQLLGPESSRFDHLCLAQALPAAP